MNRKQLGFVFVAVSVVVVAVVVLLATAGGDGPGVPVEKTGDVQAVPGADPPKETNLVDIEYAEVRREGDVLVFEARLGAEIPKRLKEAALDLRWDIEAPDQGKFILSANLDVGPNVALIGANNNFGSSTLDDSLPGEMTIEGNTWTITIEPDEVPNWPAEFTWKLTTSLDGKPGDPQSGRAEDTVPDNGFAEVTEAEA